MVTGHSRSFYHNQRINLLHNTPPKKSPLPKKLIDELHWGPVRPSPSPGKRRCVVENSHPTRYHILMPLIPVLSHARFRVVAIYEQEINRAAPSLRRIGAEFFNPDDAPVRAASNRSMRRAPCGIDSPDATQMERVNQPKSPTGRHGFTKGDRRGTLCNSDLDESGPTGRPFAQGLIFACGVLTRYRANAQPGKHRMSQ